jgi:hypothetical protein
MQLKPITAIIVLFVVIASLSLSGCISNNPTTSPSPTTYTASSPTPTPTPMASSDFSSYFNTIYSGGTSMIKQQFTKGTSAGNTVYKGVTKNSSATGNYQYTVVIELTQSQSVAKQLYDQTVAQKLSEGFTARPDIAASYKVVSPHITEVWVGQDLYTDRFYVMYNHDSNVSPSWLVTTEAGGVG